MKQPNIRTTKHPNIPAGKKTYVLGMFPYPSGDGLHVGHVRIFTACDVMARYFRMKAQGSQGSEPRDRVLSPMGWDAFGLPAENAAIKNKTIPQKIVPRNYANFKKQMQNLSLSFDWTREFATTDPEYYALTQWIFLQLYNKRDEQGRRLVYREHVPINWCPKCLTGLANEEVLGDGTHERCGTVVGKKLLPQWVMRITSYAERLLTDLDVDLTAYFSDSANQRIRGSESRKGLDWPTGILEMQRNWIGKKEGAKVTFKIQDAGFKIQEIEVFTTRIDTINGVTFVVVAPEIVQQWMQDGWQADDTVRDYVSAALQKSEQTRLEGEKEKTGVATGIVVVNPFNNELVPVWVADYALANVGTGAVMGVPQYDERDLAFAHKYDLPVKDLALDDYEVVLQKLEKMGVARRETTYHLRDWVFSRQRYWGEPIPLVFCENCGTKSAKHKFSNSQIEEQELDVVEVGGKRCAVVPLPEEQLPLTLPELESYEPTETGESPLARVTDWVNTKCPRCGGPATRETDTMPNWAGSCWYFLAFAFWGVSKPIEPGPVGEKQDSLQGLALKAPYYTDWWYKVAKPEIDKWLPVDWYLGGAEHAVLHLLYARFWVKVLYDLGLVDFPEPFLRLRSVGLVLAEDGKKMSKSLGNVVNPDDMVTKYGSDAVRMYEMFMGPWEQSIAWDSGAISGQVRFLGRIRETVRRNTEHVTRNTETTPALAAKLKDLVTRVEDGVLNQKFNTAIAGMMEFVNAWRGEGMVLAPEHVTMFLSLLSLFAPETAAELVKSQSSDHSPKIAQGSELAWPDVSAIRGVETAAVTIAVQVNGKLRGTIAISAEEAANKDQVVEVALAQEIIKKWVPGEPKKVIFVPGRLVNLIA